MKKHIVALAVAAGLVTAGLIALPANAESAHSGLSSSSSVKYSDGDVVDFFIFASGPAAKAHPEILENLGAKPKAEPAAKDLATVTTALLNVDPVFHKRVTLDVQAGDPYKAESAVKRLVADVQTLQGSGATKKLDATASAGKNSTTFFPYTTVAVTAVAVVTVLAVASVAGIFLALYQSPADSSDLARQDLTANLAASF